MSGKDPEPTTPGHSVAGRHVLGSTPEALEPVKAASVPALPSSDATPAAEPVHTIHGETWRDARRRASALARPPRALLLAALDHVEAGWAYVRELQRWYEEHHERASGHNDAYAQLLEFIDADLVDVFRDVAAATAGLVPGYPDWADDVDPGTLEGDLETFDRYLTLFLLAVEQAPVPEGLRGIARVAAEGLAGWCTELGVLVTAIESTVIGPALGKGPPPGRD